ncbi:MAG: hypothetical protein HQK59_02345 [Deltaproteobacteria bacterium]|nr:hypothetical protein [Deltaproteobacteria bacterium]
MNKHLTYRPKYLSLFIMFAFLIFLFPAVSNATQPSIPIKRNINFNESDKTITIDFLVEPSPDFGVVKIKIDVETQGTVLVGSASVPQGITVVKNQRYVYKFPASFSGIGQGEVTFTLSCMDKDDKVVFAPRLFYFFINDKDGLTSSPSSTTHARENQLNNLLSRKIISPEEFQKQYKKLTSYEVAPDHTPRPYEYTPENIKMDRIMGRLDANPKNSRSSTSDVRGTCRYATSATAFRPIRYAVVEIYDTTGTTPVLLGTTSTDDAGNYGYFATEGLPASIVARVLATHDSIGSSQGTEVTPPDNDTLYELQSPITSAGGTSVTINLDGAFNTAENLAFAIQDCTITAYAYYKSIIARSEVGKSTMPDKLRIRFPGPNPNGSYYSKTNNYIVIGAGHAKSWDVICHEYGHYIQNINGINASRGNDHYIRQNMTGWKQNDNHVLTKDEALKLAYAEGWPTYMGTILQISMGADKFGLPEVGDTKYWDPANGFGYDLENNSNYARGVGEDNELSVQRVLWDLHDAPLDEHDEVQFGADAMWRLFVDTKPLTLPDFWAQLKNTQPPRLYPDETVAEWSIRYGGIFADHNIGPQPLEPANHAPFADSPPTFKWLTKGANEFPASEVPAASYRYDQFILEFWNKDYTTMIGSISKSTTDDQQTTCSVTPDATLWSKILAEKAPVHWVVKGRNSRPPVNDYIYGFSSTLSGVNLALVIDDTGSMSDDIDNVKAGMIRFIDLLKLVPKYKPVVQLITFKDFVTQRLVTDDLDAMKTAINGLYAAGGGDCPEASAEALLVAAKNMTPSSYSVTGLNGTIYLATDASPHSGWNIGAVRDSLAAKGIRVVTTLTGDCLGSTGTPSQFDRISDNHDPHWAPSDIPDSTFNDTIGTGTPLSSKTSLGDISYGTGGVLMSFAKGDTSGAVSSSISNVLVSSVTPGIVKITPSSFYKNSTFDVMIYGNNTNFSPTSKVGFWREDPTTYALTTDKNVTVTSVKQISPTQLLANVTTTADLASGTISVTVETPLTSDTTEKAEGRGSSTVAPPPSIPSILSMNPDHAALGKTLSVTIVTMNMDLTKSLDVQFDSYVKASNIAVSGKAITATLTVDSSTEALGSKTLTVVSGGTSYSMANALLVVSGVDPTTPAFDSINPNKGLIGDTINVVITGKNTNFTASSTVAFSGGSIVVNSVTANSDTQLTANITIPATAAPRFVDVVVTTGTQTLTSLNAFEIASSSIISMNIGWNLVSLCRQPADTTLATVVAPIAGKFVSIWTSVGGAWKMYDPANPGFSDLTTIESGKGYWFNMTQGGVLSVSGNAASKSVSLTKGWNLVGYSSCSSLSIDQALASISGTYQSVWSYVNNAWKYYDPSSPGFSDLTSMSPGYGYWINATAACTWTLP